MHGCISEELPVAHKAIGEFVFVEVALPLSKRKLRGEGDDKALGNVEGADGAFQADIVNVANAGWIEERNAVAASAGFQHFGNCVMRAKAEAAGELAIVTKGDGMINAIGNRRAEIDEAAAIGVGSCRRGELWIGL